MIRAVLARVSQSALLLRFHPFDTATPEGRSHERHRLAAFAAIASALAKFLSIATGLVSVPLALHYLGAERYGMWMTMSSIVALLSFSDFGIGNGILNAVSTAHGRDEHHVIRRYASSGLAVLGTITLVIIGGFAALYHFVPWYKLFNVTSQVARQDAAPALAALIFCFALTIPLNVVQRVQMGLQRGFLANLWQCAGSLLGLIGVVLAVHLHASLAVLILAYIGSPLLVYLLNTIIFFGWQEPRYAPRLRDIDKIAMSKITHLGFLFFIMQLVAAFIFSSDNIVIAQILGASTVTAYAVPQRLFAVIPAVIGMALVPLWPAYGEAVARGDHDWVWKTLLRSLAFAIGLSALGSLFFIFTGNWILAHWVGRGVLSSWSLLLGLGVWQVIQCGGMAVSMYLNGANVVRLQVILGMISAIVAIALKIYLVSAIGSSGAVWATSISYVLCVAIPVFFYIYRRTARS